MRKLNIETLVVPPIYSNCYILSDEAGNAVVIDPGGIAEEIIRLIEEKNLRVEAILNTHGHIDHIGGNPEVHHHTAAPIFIHQADAEMLTSGILCGAEWSGVPFQEHTHDRELVPGELTNTGNFSFEVMHTPGHSPGSVCLILHESKIVFSGDLIFLDSIGRSDLPGGHTPTLMNSLREFLKVLPDDYKVFPGHGAPTTVARERNENPFLQRL